MSLYFKYYLCIFLLSAESKILESRDEVVEGAFEKYALELKLNQPTFQDIFINSGFQECSKIVQYFIARAGYHTKIIDNGNIKNIHSLRATKHAYIFVFIKTFHAIFTSLANLPDHPFWFNRAFVQFIVCEPFENWYFSNLMLEAIWREKIFNFVLIFFTDKLYVRSFNTFQPEKFLEFTNKTKNDKNLFPNKLRNVHGFNFHVGILRQNANLDNNVSNVLYNKHLEILNTLIKYSNGSLTEVTLKHPPKTLELPFLHFIFMKRVPTIDDYQEVEFISPLHKNSLACLVPKASLIPPYQYFFMIFNFDSLLAFCILILVVAVIVSLANNVNFIQNFFEAYYYLLSGSLPHFIMRPYSSKIIYMFFILFSLLVSVIFHTSLTTDFLTKKYNLEINSVHKLLSSNLTIYVDKDYQDQLPSEIYNRAIPVSNEILLKMIFKRMPNAYILLETFILAILTKRNSDMCTAFHVMREDVVPGYIAYVFPKTSPYVDHIDHFLRLYDSVKSEMLLEDWTRKYQTPPPFKRIEWQHWKGILSILLFGYGISFITLFLEIAFKKFKWCTIFSSLA